MFFLKRTAGQARYVLGGGQRVDDSVERGIRVTTQNNTAITNLSDGYRITKTGAAAQNGAAVSALLTGNFLLRMEHTAAALGAALGFGSDPTASNDFTDLPYAIAWSSQTQLYTYVNGVFTEQVVNSASGIFNFRRVGTTISVVGDNTYDFAAASGANLGFRSSLYFDGEAIDVRLTGALA